MNIQDPNLPIPCFACEGKGYFLLWSRRETRFVTRQSYLKSPFVRSGDSYMQVDCGECGGTGKMDGGEVKY